MYQIVDVDNHLQFEVRKEKKFFIMKLLTIILLIVVVVYQIYALKDKTLNEKKVELAKILNKEVGFHSSYSWESRERRRIRQMGYYRYCYYYPNNRVCRNPNRYQNRYPNPNQNRYRNRLYTTFRPLPLPYNFFRE